VGLIAEVFLRNIGDGLQRYATGISLFCLRTNCWGLKKREEKIA
jgi:hypothetical protein